MSKPSPDRPLKIAIVTGSISRLAGGLFNSVRKSALSLHELGHEVTVISTQDQHSRDDAAEWAPLEPVAAQRHGPGALAYSPEVGKALRAGSFDLVHQHGIWQFPSVQVSKWRKTTGLPVMISPRGMLDPWALAHSGWKKKLTGALYENANLSGASCLHALNASEAAAMRAFGLANPIAVIPNGADLDRPGDHARPKDWPQGKVLLFIGRIHPKKGLAELVRGFAKAELHGWSMVVAGWDDGGHLEPLRQQIAALGLAGRIHLPGPLYGDDKQAALRHADGFVLPSFSEGLPMSVLEAWSASLPVLMTDECNLPEGFAQGAAIRITQNPDEIADVLTAQLAAASDEHLREIGARGRALVEQRFGWPQIARDHVEVYRWMTGTIAEAPACVQFAEEAAQ